MVMQSHLRKSDDEQPARRRAYLSTRCGEVNFPHLIPFRLISSEAWWQMDPLPLVPATCIDLQGNSTFRRSWLIRPRPGWIMAVVEVCYL